MMSGDEAQEIRHLVHQELADIESQVTRCAGSYNYLCSCGGVTVFSHKPLPGWRILRTILHPYDEIQG